MTVETVETSSWEPAVESALQDDLDFTSSDLGTDDEESASAAAAGSDSEY